MTESAASEITTRSTGIRYGVIMGVIGIVYFVGLNLADVDMSKGIAKWGMSLVSIVIIFLAQKYYRDNGDSFMSYGQGIGIAFWTGVVSSVLSSIFTYIYIKFVDTGYITKIREAAQAEMEAKGQSDEQIEMAMKFVDMFTNAEAILIFGIVFGIIGSVVIGLLVSIVMQKPRPETAL
ncbi:DUF4199 domain-containing protein [Chryseolinea lacunae]|uniref:DUF4199 domain-containing protein n=1 Tax=Chryseolinea lacunae TaxID=2801331 RepID=A0ABS1L0W2_9BACT|nr:DUF4199 domain-containing protein [Chryseolinea lacunae]MBL0745152.1 DUF4199 domain-containing protein [Chryseolinea lacunae]